MKSKAKWAGVIYVLTNLVNGKQYVGKTTREAGRRWNDHIKAAEQPTLPIHKAIKKYGVENFSAEVLQRCKTLENLSAAEIRWINRLNAMAPGGYNLTQGGDGFVGAIHKESSKKKVSATLKKYYEENPAARAKRSEILLAYYKEPEAKARLSATHLTVAAVENTSKAQRIRFENKSERVKSSLAAKKWMKDPLKKAAWLAGQKLIHASPEHAVNCAVGAKKRFSDPVKLANYLVVRHHAHYGPHKMKFEQAVKLAKARITSKN